MENVAESVEKKRAKRTKYPKYPKHACVTRTYKFAMDVPTTKSVRFFDACNQLCAMRNRLVEHLSEQRRTKWRAPVLEPASPGRNDPCQNSWP